MPPTTPIELSRDEAIEILGALTSGRSLLEATPHATVVLDLEDAEEILIDKLFPDAPGGEMPPIDPNE